MKDEIFDELLKQRIESQELPFSSSEVDRVHRHVQNNLTGTHSVKSLRKIVGKYAVSGLLAVGSALGVAQYFQNKELTTKLEKIENKLKQYESNLKLATTAPKTKLSQLPAVSSDPNHINQGKMDVFENVNKFARREQIDQVNVPQDLEKLQKDYKETFAINATNESKTTSPSNVNELRSDVSAEKQLIEFQVDTLVNKKVVLLEKMANLAKPTKDTAAIADSIREIKNMLPKINYGVGFAGNIGMEERGLGLVVSMVKNKRWQFQSGIRVSQYDGKLYEDDEDFWRSEKLNFASYYGTIRPGIHIKDIQNIQFKYRTVHVPMSISCLLPLKKDFSFVVGLGSDFSMRTQEIISYRSRIEPGNIVMNHELNTIQNSIFSLDNAVFTIGVQKQWKGFAFQSLIYLDKKIGDVNYRQLPMSAGLSVQILYYFRK